MSTTTRRKLLQAIRMRLRLIGGAAGYVVPLMMVVLLAREWNGIPGQPRDTLAYYLAANAARDGSNVLYPAGLAAGPLDTSQGWPYVYSPVLAALLSFMPPMSYVAFDRVWLILNVAAFWMLAIALARIAAGVYAVHATLLWSAALFFSYGSLLSIHFANIDLIIVAMLAWGLVLERAGGALYSMGTAFKITPLWPTLVLLTRRPRSGIPSALIVVAVCLGACVAAFGYVNTLGLTEYWLTAVVPNLGQGQMWGGSAAALRNGGLNISDYLGNLSLTLLPIQIAIMRGWGYAGGPLPPEVRAYLTLVAVGAPLLVAVLVRRRSVNVQIAAVATAAYFAAPIVRPYVLPVVLLLVAALTEERRVRAARATPGNGEALSAAPSSPMRHPD